MFNKKIFFNENNELFSKQIFSTAQDLINYIESYGYPLVMNGVKTAKSLIDYKIYGNSQQNNTPTPDNPIEVQAVGIAVDLWADSSRVNGYLSQTGTVVSVSDSATTNYIKVTPSTYYTAYMEMSDNYEGNSIRFCFYDSNKSMVDSIQMMYIPTTYAFDVQVPSDAVYMRVSMGTDSTKVTKQMLVEGKYTAGEIINLPTGYKIPVTATNSIQTVTTDIYLNKPLYKINNFVDVLDFQSKRVERNVGVKSLTGAETDWDMDFYNDFFYTNDNTFMDMEGEHGEISVLSTHFNSQDNAVATDTSVDYCCFPYSNQYYASIGFRYKAITDVDSWKQYLASLDAPVQVYYPLIEPVYETVDLSALPVFEGTTTYAIEGLEPSDMYGKAKE